MKKLALFILLSLPAAVNAQESTPISFSEVVKVDSVNKDELFNRARSWFNKSFRSSKDVLNINDKETGALSGKGLMQYYSKIFMGSEATRGVIRFTVTIQVKDGRYKYSITDFVHESTAVGASRVSFDLITEDTECPYKRPMTSKKWQNKVWEELKEKSRSEGEGLALSIKQTMNKASFKNEEW